MLTLDPTPPTHTLVYICVMRAYRGATAASTHYVTKLRQTHSATLTLSLDQWVKGWRAVEGMPLSPPPPAPCSCYTLTPNLRKGRRPCIRGRMRMWKRGHLQLLAGIKALYVYAGLNLHGLSLLCNSIHSFIVIPLQGLRTAIFLKEKKTTLYKKKSSESPCTQKIYMKGTFERIIKLWHWGSATAEGKLVKLNTFSNSCWKLIKTPATKFIT